MLRRLLYRNFTAFYWLDRWFRDRLAPSGRLLVAGLLTSGIFGVDVRMSLAFQVFALGVGILAVAALGVVAQRPRLAVTRRLPRFATVGEPLRYRLTIANAGRRACPALEVRESPGVRLPGFEDFVRARVPGDEHRNRFDRYVGFPRWVWLVRNRQGITAAAIPVPAVAAGDTVRVQASLVPMRRGHVHLAALVALLPEPLGCLRTVRTLSCPGSVLVLPRAYPAPRIALAAGARTRAAGAVDRRTLHGVDEFRSIREYRPGDPLRHVDWRASARLGEPMTKEFHDERRAGIGVVLDTRGEPESVRFEAAVSVAASIVQALRRTGECELLLVDRTGEPDGPRRLRRARDVDSAMALLATARARPTMGADDGEVLARHPLPRSVVVVLPDFLPERLRLLEACRRLTVGAAWPIVVVDGEPRTGEAPVPTEASTVRVGALAEDIHRLRPRGARPRLPRGVRESA